LNGHVRLKSRASLLVSRKRGSYYLKKRKKKRIDRQKRVATSQTEKKETITKRS